MESKQVKTNTKIYTNMTSARRQAENMEQFHRNMTKQNQNGQLNYYTNLDQTYQITHSNRPRVQSSAASMIEEFRKNNVNKNVFN